MDVYIQSARPLVIERAEGTRIFDKNGRSYIDGNSSWWTALLGHNHPRLVSALREQATSLCHVALGGIIHESAAHLALRLAALCPGLPHVFFSDNGSTAVEAAMKMALQYQAQVGAPARTEFLALDGAFHGETLGVTALSGVGAFRAPFSSAIVSARRLPSPADPEVGLEAALTALECALQEASTVAALVLEPLVQGAGGMRVYSPLYLKRARELTAQAGVLLIVDEVFTGFGRTGTFWASSQAEIIPDVLCAAKGLSGGLLPLAATLASSRVFEAFWGGKERAFYYGHTYAGNPLGTRVALEVLSVYEDENVLGVAQERAQQLALGLERFRAMPGVEQVRSLGMIAAFDLGGNANYLQPLGWEVYQEALERGAYLRPLGNVIYAAPPLNIPSADLQELLDILEKSVRVVLERHGAA